NQEEALDGEPETHGVVGVDWPTRRVKPEAARNCTYYGREKRMIAAARNKLNIDPGVLQRVLGRVTALPGAVVVFDLDSTVLDNRPRQARILREFGQERGIPALAHAKSEHWVDWSIQRAMANAGLPAAEVSRWAEDAKEFWRERFFTP